jgi:hypothetical protein
MRTCVVVLATGGITMLALHGCGLVVTGAASGIEPDGTDAAASWPDASGGEPAEGRVDGGDEPSEATDAAADACSSDACGFDVPAGWSLVLFARSAATQCPAGFVTESAVTNAAAAAGACTCSPSSCTVTSTPSCDDGVVATKLDSAAAPTCNQSGINLDLNEGKCTKLNASLGKHASIAAPSPKGTGACKAAAVPNPAAVTATEVRVCTSDSCATVCGEAPASGLERCLIASGDQACPADAPKKTVIGTKASLACGDCATCAVTASCSGTISFYSDESCNSVLRTFTSNVCADGDTPVRSFKWTGAAKDVSCVPSGPPAPKVDLEEQRTVCCK